MTTARTTGTVVQERPEGRQKPGSVLRSGAVMAAGSVVSRATGFVRSAVVVAALGTGLTADGYTVANTVPNILYMLLIGGALNAVFVPELVRAAREHSDDGAAYTDRLLTVCTVGLVALTALAVVGAPLIVGTYTDYSGEQAELTIALARYCLPQILFYGLFTLLGQVLNARNRFGAMMWTPVLNNVVIIAVFGLYLVVVAGSGGELTATHARLLGWGTTAGIVVQTLALVPALRAAKFRWRPRFDWRGSGPLRKEDLVSDDVLRAFGRIESWLEENAPLSWQSLQPPASEAAIRAAETNSASRSPPNRRPCSCCTTAWLPSPRRSRRTRRAKWRTPSSSRTRPCSTWTGSSPSTGGSPTRTSAAAASGATCPGWPPNPPT